MGADDRIPTDLWVAAQIRSCHARGTPAFLSRKGANVGGVVLVKVLDVVAKQCRVFTQSRDFDGNSGWLAAFDGASVADEKADSYIGRAVARDPDLWVIEVETRDGAMPFEGKILGV